MVIARLLHIVVSIWFIAGLLGRWLAYAQARRACDIRVIGALLRLSDRFERTMVIPGSQGVLILGLLTSWLQGRPLLGGAHINWLPVSLMLVLSLIPVVVFVLIPRRKHRLSALETALMQDAVTPELQAALADTAVLVARSTEMIVTAVVLALMILKPF